MQRLLHRAESTVAEFSFKAQTPIKIEKNNPK